MTRLIGYVLLSLAITLGITWLLATPGIITIDVAGYRLQPKIGVAAIALLGLVTASILVWTLFFKIVSLPAWLQSRTARKRQSQGIESLSAAFIALQAGNADKARNLARDAAARLPDNAAAKLLEARAELALGRWGEARDQYRDLLDNPQTAIAALSGLYEQARAQNRPDAALTFARKAYSLTPELTWAGTVIFQEMTRNRNWTAALKMVHKETARNREEKAAKKRKLAVLHTAIAGANEADQPNEALDNARIALKLEPDFVPAALIAARIHSNKEELRKAASLLRRVWRATHHPHVAELFASVQPGISPVERLKRLRDLFPDPPPDTPSAIVLAQMAIKAADYETARKTLQPHLQDNASRSVCVAMAKIEELQHADHGKARHWLSRAVNAFPDPVWIADGVTANEWEPVSPVTGELDAFEFKVPTNNLHASHHTSTDFPPSSNEGSDLIIQSGPTSSDKALPDKDPKNPQANAKNLTTDGREPGSSERETANSDTVESAPSGADPKNAPATP